MFVFNQKKGYTIVEILISMAIIGTIFTLGYVGFRDFSRRQILSAAQSMIIDDLHLAREQAIAGKKPADCTGSLNGYSFQVLTDGYEVVADCSISDAAIKQVSLSEGLTLDLPTPNPIIFKPIGVGTNVDKTAEAIITINQVITQNKSYVSVSSTGEVGVVSGEEQL
jgi:prepilin-type N-terminal cleavage/methylation domain-containing protein